MPSSLARSQNPPQARRARRQRPGRRPAPMPSPSAAPRWMMKTKRGRSRRGRTPSAARAPAPARRQPRQESGGDRTSYLRMNSGETSSNASACAGSRRAQRLRGGGLTAPGNSLRRERARVDRSPARVAKRRPPRPGASPHRGPPSSPRYRHSPAGEPGFQTGWPSWFIRPTVASGCICRAQRAQRGDHPFPRRLELGRPRHPRLGRGDQRPVDGRQVAAEEAPSGARPSPAAARRRRNAAPAWSQGGARWRTAPPVSSTACACASPPSG